MTRQLESNEDLVHDLMNYSPFGAICQVFIVFAIQEYAKRVLADKEHMPQGFIHPDTWKGVAKDMQERMDKFYSRHDRPVEA